MADFSREEQEEAIRRYREAIVRSVEQDEKIGNYAQDPNRDDRELDRMRELGRQYDADEASAKAEYERTNCQSITAHSADGFRHEVIVDKRVEERNAERERVEKSESHHL